MHSRRSFLKHAGLLAMAAGLPFQSVFAQTGAFTLLRRNVGLYSNRGGTIGWMFQPDGTIVVDSQYPDQAAEFLVGAKERRDSQIDVLFNTHHHGDHTGGNGTMKAKKIVAQEQVPILQVAQGGRTTPVVATETFKTEWEGTFGDETVNAHHLKPAHSGSDTIIHFEEANVAHMGDLVFNRVYPFIDRNSGGRVKGWIETLEAALKRYDNETLYILGHGNPAFGVQGNASDVEQMRDYLTALITQVETGIKRGKSREEITTMMILPGFEDYVSFGPRLSLTANLETVYDELTA